MMMEMSDHAELFGYFAKKYESDFKNNTYYNISYGNSLIVDYDNKTVWIEWGKKV